MHACTQATTALNSPVPFSDDPNILPKEQVPPPLADSMSAVAAMGNVSAAQMMQVGGCLGEGWWLLRVLSDDAGGRLGEGWWVLRVKGGGCLGEGWWPVAAQGAFGAWEWRLVCGVCPLRNNIMPSTPRHC